MSVRARRLSDPRNEVTHDDGSIWLRCCDSQAPVPLWRLLSLYPSMGPEIRELLTQAGEDPDELWCPGCSTGLEDLRDGFVEGGPAFLRVVASVAAFVPGIGTGIATALGAAAALAEGESISDAMIAGARAALPASAALEVAAASGKALLDGKPIDQAALAGARAAAVATGGKLAGAAFDAVVAISEGKTLQDAGFATLNAFAEGNTIAERGLAYAEVITRAAQEGRPVGEVLARELATDVARVAGPGARTMLRPVVERLKLDPSLITAGSNALAFALGVPEPIARGAQSVMRTGAEDLALFDLLTRTGVQTAVEKYGAAIVASRAVNASYAETLSAQREEQLMAVARLPSTSLSYRTARAEQGIPLPSEPLELLPFDDAEFVRADVPKRRTSAIGDVALGGVVAGAALALVWWAKSS